MCGDVARSDKKANKMNEKQKRALEALDVLKVEFQTKSAELRAIIEAPERAPSLQGEATYTSPIEIEAWHGVKDPNAYIADGKVLFAPKFGEFDTTGKIEPGAWFSPDEKFALKYGQPVKFILTINNALRHEGPLSKIPDGYDAVYRTHGKGDSIADALEIAVFSPSQIRLATPIPENAIPLDAIGNAGQETQQPDAAVPSNISNAASRVRPREAIVFGKPLVGPSGARLVAYEWQWQPFEYIDKYGEERTARISDWEKAESSHDTGRDIVHQFTVQMPDDTSKTVSAESAIKLLGFNGGSSEFKATASGAKTLAKLRMQLEEGQQLLAARECDQAEVDALPLPAIERTDEKWWAMGDSRVRQMEGGNTINEERKRALIEGWRDNRMRERGWNDSVYGMRSKVNDLNARIARQEKKLGATLRPRDLFAYASSGKSNR